MDQGWIQENSASMQSDNSNEQTQLIWIAGFILSNDWKNWNSVLTVHFVFNSGKGAKP